MILGQKSIQAVARRIVVVQSLYACGAVFCFLNTYDAIAAIVLVEGESRARAKVRDCFQKGAKNRSKRLRSSLFLRLFEVRCWLPSLKRVLFFQLFYRNQPLLFETLRLIPQARGGFRIFAFDANQSLGSDQSRCNLDEMGR